MYRDMGLAAAQNEGCFAVTVVKGSRRTDLPPRTPESAGSHELAGGGCQQAELVVDPSESVTVTAITETYWR